MITRVVMNWVYIVFPLVVLLCLGFIGGGATLCWASTTHNACSDWGTKRFGESCGITNANVIAAIKCDTICYCQQIDYDYVCLDMPTGVSPTYIGWGVVLILIGVVGLVAGGFFLLKM